MNSKWVTRLLWWTGLILALIVTTKMVLSIHYGDGHNHVAGAWTAIAQDLVNGVFYRPLYAEESGFGGTRFFPLYFSLHALVIKFTGLPLLSGHLVSLTSGLLLLCTFYLLLLKTRISKVFIFAFMALLLAPANIQHGFETIRGDILPLALNILGLLVFLSRLPDKYKEILASACFVLAFSAKVTSIAGVVSLLLWLILNGRKNEAIRILLYTMSGTIAFLVLIYFMSSERVFMILATCASADTGWRDLLAAPAEFLNSVFKYDPLIALYLFWGLLIIFNDNRDALKSLPSYFLVTTFLITIIMYGSPGVAANHLVDLAVSTLWVIAVSLKSRDTRSRQASSYMLISIMLTASLLNLSGLKKDIQHFTEQETLYPQELVSLIKTTEGHVVSEDPTLIIKANKTPYVLDPFMLRIVTKAYTPAHMAILEQIRNKKFPLIIFLYDPEHKKHWYTHSHFGEDNMNAIFENYQESHQFGRFTVYSPKFSPEKNNPTEK